MLFAILFNFAGLGLLCWLLYALAVDALAFFAALSIAFAAFNAGAGIVGAVALALIAGVGVLTLIRIGVAATRSWSLRLAITLIYAIPAGVAGYQLSGAFAGLGGASGGWRDAMAFLGALAVAAAALARLEAPPPDPAR
jgi:hypothetical protein